MESSITTSTQFEPLASIVLAKGNPITGHPGCFWALASTRPHLQRHGAVEFRWDAGFDLVLADRTYPHTGPDDPAGTDPAGNPIDFLFTGSSVGLSGQEDQGQRAIVVSLAGFIDLHPYQYLACLVPPGTTTLPDNYDDLKALWDLDFPPALGRQMLADDEEEPEVIVGSSGDPGPTGRPTTVIQILRPTKGEVFRPEADGRITLPLKGLIGRIDEPDASIPDRRYLWLLDRDPRVVFRGPEGTIRPLLSRGKHQVMLRLAGTQKTETVQIVVEASAVPPAPPAPPRPRTRRSLLQRLLDFFRRLFGAGR